MKVSSALNSQPQTFAQTHAQSRNKNNKPAFGMAYRPPRGADAFAHQVVDRLGPETAHGLAEATPTVIDLATNVHIDPSIKGKNLVFTITNLEKDLSQIPKPTTLFGKFWAAITPKPRIPKTVKSFETQSVSRKNLAEKIEIGVDLFVKDHLDKHVNSRKALREAMSAPKAPEYEI